MEKKFEKGRYFGQLNHRGEGINHLVKDVVFAEDFETLKKFYDFCKDNSYQVSFCPLNHAKSMAPKINTL